MLGRKYWAEDSLPEPSAQKQWSEGSTQFTLFDSSQYNGHFSRKKDVLQVSIHY